jgi:hypothetical protein
MAFPLDPSFQNGPHRPGFAAPRLTARPGRLIGDPETKCFIQREADSGAHRKGVYSASLGAFHRSKHLIVLLFEPASRCYEYLTATVDVSPEWFEQRDALGSRNECSEDI